MELLRKKNCELLSWKLHWNFCFNFFCLKKFLNFFFWISRKIFFIQKLGISIEKDILKNFQKKLSITLSTIQQLPNNCHSKLCKLRNMLHQLIQLQLSCFRSPPHSRSAFVINCLSTWSHCVCVWNLLRIFTTFFCYMLASPASAASSLLLDL